MSEQTSITSPRAHILGIDLNDPTFVPKTIIEIECSPINAIRIGEALFEYIAQPFEE